MRTRRMSVFGVLAVFILSVLASMVAIVPASASVKGRRNTAYALTGLAAYQLLRGKTGTGLLLGGGAYYAWKRVKAKEKEQQRAYYRRHSRYAHRR